MIKSLLTIALAAGIASVTFAQTPAPAADSTTAPTTKVAKKHHKKHAKKASKKAATTPAAAETPAAPVK